MSRLSIRRGDGLQLTGRLFSLQLRNQSGHDDFDCFWGYQRDQVSVGDLRSIAAGKLTDYRCILLQSCLEHLARKIANRIDIHQSLGKECPTTHSHDASQLGMARYLTPSTVLSSFGKIASQFQFKSDAIGV